MLRPVERDMASFSWSEESRECLWHEGVPQRINDFSSSITVNCIPVQPMPQGGSLKMMEDLCSEVAGVKLGVSGKSKPAEADGNRS